MSKEEDFLSVIAKIKTMTDREFYELIKGTRCINKIYAYKKIRAQSKKGNK